MGLLRVPGSASHTSARSASPFSCEGGEVKAATAHPAPLASQLFHKDPTGSDCTAALWNQRRAQCAIPLKKSACSGDCLRIDWVCCLRTSKKQRLQVTRSPRTSQIPMMLLIARDALQVAFQAGAPAQLHKHSIKKLVLS